MDQVLQGLADIDPLFPLLTELRVLVHLDAVLVEVERLADHLGLLLVLKLAEGANERLIDLLAE